MFLLLFLFLSHRAQAASVTAELDRDTIAVNESAILQLKFEGLPDGSPPELPKLPNLNLRYAGYKWGTEFNNLRRSSFQVFSYEVSAPQPGDYVIPGFQFRAGTEVISTQPLQLRVVKSGTAGTAGTNALAQYCFLRLIAPKNELYLGEVLPTEIQLYFANAQDVQMPQLQADGFTLGKSAQPLQTQANVNRQLYNVYVFKSSVTAAKTGNLTLGPAQTSLNLRLPANPNRRRDPFDGFDDPFGFFGARYQLKPADVASDPLSIHVRPLPSENVPASFNGAVGSFTMTVQAGPTNVMVGDPITVKITLTGKGPLDTLTLPPIDEGANFKSFALTNRVESPDPLGLQGLKQFEYVLTPQNAEIKSLPPIRFSFFDPEQKTYRTLEQPPLAINVRATGVASVAPVLPGNPNAAREPGAVQDIVNIKARSGVIRPITPPLILRRWFMAFLGLPVASWFSMVLWIRYRENRNRNPRLRRQRQVARLIERGLAELRHHAEADHADAFYAVTFRLMQEQLGERLDLPATAITEAVIEERLRPLGVPEEALALVREVLHRCNQYRYAPSQESRGLFLQFPKVEAALKTLRQLDSNALPVEKKA